MPDQLQGIVQRMIDAGEPEENIATVIQHFKSQTPPSDQGVLAGIGQTLPTPSRVIGMLRTIPQMLRERTTGTRDMITGQLNDPTAAAAESAETPIGKIMGGRPGEGFGNVLGIGGQFVAAEALPKVVGRLRTPTPTPPVDQPHLDLSKPVRPGRLTQEQLAERMKLGPPPQSTIDEARAISGARISRSPLKTAGSGAATVSRPPAVAEPAAATPASSGPTAQPLPQDAPMWAQPQASGGGALSPQELAESMRRYYGSEKAGRMLQPGSSRSGQAAVQRLAEGPSRLPLAAENAQLDQRFLDRIADPRGSVTPSMLKLLGLQGRALAYPMAYHYGGALGAGALGAADLASLAVSHPQATAQATRAALLAQLMASHGVNQNP